MMNRNTKNFLLAAICCWLTYSCNNNKNLLIYETLISEVNLEGRHNLILLPTEGCSGCLSSMKRFYLSNRDDYELLLIYNDEKERLAYANVNPELAKNAFYINQTSIFIEHFDPNYPMIVEWGKNTPKFIKTDAAWFLRRLQRQ